MTVEVHELIARFNSALGERGHAHAASVPRRGEDRDHRDEQPAGRAPRHRGSGIAIKRKARTFTSFSALLFAVLYTHDRGQGLGLVTLF